MANVRVMVPDVDGCWRRAGEIGARVVSPIADRDYGLRDFTIADPDGFGVRFASKLAGGATARASGGDDPDRGGPIRILGICGSLRAASSNGSLIQALGALAPDGVEVSVYQGMEMCRRSTRGSWGPASWSTSPSPSSIHRLVRPTPLRRCARPSR